jgi:hypothetical protein
MSPFKNDTTRRAHTVAQDYFTRLGAHLPVQCASDEFYFLPRAEPAVRNLSMLDDLSPETINDHLAYVRALLREIHAVGYREEEEEIDRLLLTQSMEGFLREYEVDAVWQHDPTLYLKVALFATDLVISRGDRPIDKIKGELSAVFDQIPGLLGLGVRNLIAPSEISIQVALEMAHDAVGFYNRDIRLYIAERAGDERELALKVDHVVEALEEFISGLKGLRTKPEPAAGEECLRRILSVSFGYTRPLDQIVEIAQEAFFEIQERLDSLAKHIDGDKTWKRIIYEKAPAVASPEELMEQYEREIQALRAFFSSRDIIPLPTEERLMVLHTPVYLESLRATASYQAPLTGDAEGRGVFYVTPGLEDLGVISAHCPYLSAHETYPGHHILDHLRIHHPNPIRRQIESPLFYEGWACYAEQLLDECGYVTDPRVQLIQLKRQLWRTLRAILDVKIHTGRISLPQAAAEIENLGFSRTRAQRQVRRFDLTPGYQLCYFMGSHEILDLRRRFAPSLGLREFHEILLTGGQLPFHLVEKRLEARKGKKD